VRFCAAVLRAGLRAGVRAGDRRCARWKSGSRSAAARRADGFRPVGFPLEGLGFAFGLAVASCGRAASSAGDIARARRPAFSRRGRSCATLVEVSGLERAIAG
jgi:hypothetical protein